MNSNWVKNIYSLIPLPDNHQFKKYLYAIIHSWSKTLIFLVFILVPVFFILDQFTIPGDLLMRFALYRSVGIVIAFAQYIVLLKTRPGKVSYIHGYIVTIVVGGMIVVMTADLGGFDSTYYAGLNLVIIGVNLLLPWEVWHSIINSLLILLMYISINLLYQHDFIYYNLVNNLFFMTGTIILAVIINYVRYKLIEMEFNLRFELKSARDSLWSEMKIAKKIQDSLLPPDTILDGYEIAAKMIPEEEVGGDYYDFWKTSKGENWMAIGDVSGHGVESGLLMMIVHTSIYSILTDSGGLNPSEVLEYANSVIRNITSRLSINRYMTILSIKLEEDNIKVAGKHQDLVIYRAATRSVDIIPTKGTWIGLTDNILDFLVDQEIRLYSGDLVLLYTDGVTESANSEGEMFGIERMVDSLRINAYLKPESIVSNLISDVVAFQFKQEDDITIVLLKKL